MATSSRARSVTKLDTCPCELIDAAPADRTAIDETPANILDDEGDRHLALNLAQITLALHIGTVDALGWAVEADSSDKSIVNIMVRYPAGTCFTLQQLNLVQLVNELRVKEVWVQPEAEAVYVGVAMWRTGVAHEFTVQDLIVLRRVAEPGATPGSRKRARIGTSKKGKS